MSGDGEAERKKALREAQATLRKSAPQMSLKSLVTTQRSVADVTNRFSELIRRKHSNNIDRVMRIASACPPMMEEACIAFEDAPELLRSPTEAAGRGAGAITPAVGAEDSSASSAAGDGASMGEPSQSGLTNLEASVSMSRSVSAVLTRTPSNAAGDRSVSVQTLQALIGSKRQRVASEATDAPMGLAIAASQTEEEAHIITLRKKHERRRLNLDMTGIGMTGSGSNSLAPPTAAAPQSAGVSPTTSTPPTPASSTGVNALAPSLYLGLNLDKRAGASAQVDALIRQTSVADADKLRRHNSFEQTSARVVVFETAGRKANAAPPSSSTGLARSFSQ